jgi:hypothetical protein
MNLNEVSIAWVMLIKKKYYFTKNYLILFQGLLFEWLSPKDILALSVSGSPVRVALKPVIERNLTFR